MLTLLQLEGRLLLQISKIQIIILTIEPVKITKVMMICQSLTKYFKQFQIICGIHIIVIDRPTKDRDCCFNRTKNDHDRKPYGGRKHILADFGRKLVSARTHFVNICDQAKNAGCEDTDQGKNPVQRTLKITVLE